MSVFDCFQLATVAVIVAVIAIKAIYLRIVTGINPIVIARGKGPWRIVEMSALGSLVLWVTEVLLHALHSRYDIDSQPLLFALLNSFAVKMAGFALVSAGLIIFVFAFLSFGNSWRIGIDRKTPGGLVTGGIFGITRNPIYVAFNLFFLGMFLLNGTIFFLIFALLASVSVHFQILREEEFLSRQYGESFEAYRKRTPRYLVW
jgi:protein-S-isoprenylcysteine O-methyltransferase Ste14